MLQNDLVPSLADKRVGSVYHKSMRVFGWPSYQSVRPRAALCSSAASGNNDNALSKPPSRTDACIPTTALPSSDINRSFK